MKCDICGCKDTYKKLHKHEIEIKNELICFKKERRFCKNCNNLVYDSYLDNEASKESIRLYNLKFGISKEQIIELRKKYNLSQEQFAKIIGCAKKTLISYEKGNSIPNDIYLVTLKMLIDNPGILKNMVESNSYRYSEVELNNINKKIELNISDNNEATIYNGFTELSKEKIINIIIYFSLDGVLKTKLLKEMFYTDFLYYKNTGASMTGLEYKKYAHGPVPNNYENILEVLENNNVIKYNIEYFNDFECHKIISKKQFDEKIFTKDELNILNKVKKYFEKFNSKKIEEFSHEEKAYVDTKSNDLISYEYAFDIDRLD